MGYWGWRPLIFALCISVLIVGCSITTDSAPTQSPTDLPRVTLTLRLPSSATPITTPTRHIITMLQPSPTLEASSTPFIHVAQSGDTLLGIAIEYGVDLNALREANGNLDPRSLQIGEQLIIPGTSDSVSAGQATPTPLALPIEPPTCYETPTLSLLCLGHVANTLDQPVEGAVVTVQLFHDDGTILLEKTANVEQTIIPAGHSAPYRVLFPTGWQGYSGIVVVLRSATSAQSVDERFITPVIEDERGTLENGYYVVSATLRNADLQSAQALRVVVTLFGDNQQVVGYRVMQPGSALPAGTSLPIQVTVVPQVGSEVLTHTLYVEAWRGS